MWGYLCFDVGMAGTKRWIKGVLASVRACALLARGWWLAVTPGVGLAVEWVVARAVPGHPPSVDLAVWIAILGLGLVAVVFVAFRRIRVPQPATPRPASDRTMRRFQAACEREWKQHRRFWEGVAAVVAILATVVMAVTHWAFFSDMPPHFSVGPSVWDYLFGSQPALGALRLAVFALAVFLIASCAALLVAGRWLRNVGGVGVTDAAANDPDADELRRAVANTETTIESVVRRYLTK
jgi:hypothetical protein